VLFGRHLPAVTPPALQDWLLQRQQRSLVLHACLPKSGSSYLYEGLGAFGGYGLGSLAPSYGVREDEIEVARLRQYPRGNWVFKHHVRPSDQTRLLQDSYGVRVVVQVRNLFDVLVSMHDHIDQYLLDPGMAWPTVPVDPAHWPTMTAEQRYRLLSEFVSPWLVSFVVRWAWEIRLNLQQDRPDAILLVRYKNLIADPQGTFGWLLRTLQPTASSRPAMDLDLDRIDDERSLLNVGVPGRGQEIDEQFPFIRQRFTALAAPYPDVNVDALLQWESRMMRAEDLLSC